MPKTAMMGHTVSSFLVLKGTAKLFSKVAKLQPAITVSLHTHQHCVLSLSFTLVTSFLTDQKYIDVARPFQVAFSMSYFLNKIFIK